MRLMDDGFEEFDGDEEPLQFKREKVRTAVKGHNRHETLTVDLGTMVGMTFQPPMPVSFTVTIDVFDSQRVKDAAALLVRFRDAVAQDADPIEALH